MDYKTNYVKLEKHVSYDKSYKEWLPLHLIHNNDPIFSINVHVNSVFWHITIRAQNGCSSRDHMAPSFCYIFNILIQN